MVRLRNVSPTGVNVLPLAIYSQQLARQKQVEYTDARPQLIAPTAFNSPAGDSPAAIEIEMEDVE